MKPTKDGEEYSIDGGKTWIKPEEGKDEVIFDNLEPGKEYEVVSRKAEDDTHNPSEPSEPTKVTTLKEDQTKPESAPNATSDTPTTITVKPTKDGEEYSIDGGKTWIKPEEGKDEVIFDNLEPGKEYEVVSRKAEDDTHNPSEPSEPTKVVTLKDHYTLTIRYLIDGKPALNTFTKAYSYGEKYEVASPAIEGYTADIATVTGNLTADITVDVTYTASEYTLTIDYLYLDGSKAAETYTAKLLCNSQYSVQSPYLRGYHAMPNLVAGTMPGRDVQLIVYYVPTSGYIDIAPTNTTENQNNRQRSTVIEIDNYGTPLGLSNVCLTAGESIE